MHQGSIGPSLWPQMLKNGLKNLASRDRAEHDFQDLITKGQGENIAWMTSTVEKCQGPRKSECVSCEDVVKKWYSEEKNYDFQKGAPADVRQPTRHFNQVTSVAV